MDGLANNWIWIALAVGMIAMHSFGHGHSRHRHGHHSHPGADATPPLDAAREPGGTLADEADPRAPFAAAAGAGAGDARPIATTRSLAAFRSPSSH